jgi:hypothetical protein
VKTEKNKHGESRSDIGAKLIGLHSLFQKNPSIPPPHPKKKEEPISHEMHLKITLLSRV